MDSGSVRISLRPIWIDRNSGNGGPAKWGGRPSERHRFGKSLEYGRGHEFGLLGNPTSKMVGEMHAHHALNFDVHPFVPPKNTHVFSPTQSM